jgi:hydrogenase maturation protease
MNAIVIGYGNTLRGDDAVGPLVAEAVAQMSWPQVQALAVHQLTPELAEAVAAADLAFFVDATAANEPFCARPIEPCAESVVLAHTGDPRTLLALAMALYGRAPQAWWLTISAMQFEYGAELSPPAREGVAQAVGWIEGHLPELPSRVFFRPTSYSVE